MADVESDTVLQGNMDGSQGIEQIQGIGEATDDGNAMMIAGASPVARPHSRGSVTPGKTISRISSAHSSKFSRPRTGSSQTSNGIRNDKEEEDSDGGYDTDLELEANREEYDTTGKTTYKEACKQCGVIPVSYFLRHMQDTELVMKHHGLGPAGAKAIAVSLISNTRILKLDLSDNWLHGKGGAAIADMLEENCYITELILSDNKLGCDGAKAVCGVLQKNDNINRVNLSGNEFDSRAAEHIAELLISNSQKVEYLNLSENHFDDSSGEILGPAIAENTSIKELNLSWNYFRLNGAVALARGLGANIFLKTVNISWNGLGLEGAIALREALIQNNVMEELDVSNNRIPTQGAVELSKGLMANDTLRILKIGRNPMQTAGAFGILYGLKENPKSAIEALDFTDVVVNKDFVELEKEVRESRPKIQIIHGGAEAEKKKPKPRPDPMSKLRKYVEENDMRMVDFFNQMDEDRSMSITHEELQKGIEQAGIMLTQEEMKHLIEELDKDGDGEINYSKAATLIGVL